MAVLLKGYRKLMVFERPSRPPRPPTPPAIEKSAIEKADFTTAELQISSVLKQAPVDIGTYVLSWVLIDTDASVGQVRRAGNGWRIQR